MGNGNGKKMNTGTFIVDIKLTNNGMIIHEKVVLQCIYELLKPKTVYLFESFDFGIEGIDIFSHGNVSQDA